MSNPQPIFNMMMMAGQRSAAPPATPAVGPVFNNRFSFSPRDNAYLEAKLRELREERNELSMKNDKLNEKLQDVAIHYCAEVQRGRTFERGVKDKQFRIQEMQERYRKLLRERDQTEAQLLERLSAAEERNLDLSQRLQQRFGPSFPTGQARSGKQEMVMNRADCMGKATEDGDGSKRRKVLHVEGEGLVTS